MRICQCDVCTRYRNLRSREVPEDVIDMLLQAEYDLEYYKAILDGSWPAAKEILEAALARCT
ncbi:hypothetical protein D3C85_374580 [compost metagenome]